MMTLYGMTDSGNCYKPRLLMAMLGLDFRHVEIDSAAGETRTAHFLAKNPNGKVPLLEWPDGRSLAESNAILLHLAEGTPFLPREAYRRALVYQWLFFEQYSHEPFIAVRRSLLRYRQRAAEATPQRLEALLSGGMRALGVMESRLEAAPFLAGEEMSVADVALFAYTSQAAAAGFDMAALPAVDAWLARVRSVPGHVPIDWTPQGG